RPRTTLLPGGGDAAPGEDGRPPLATHPGGRMTTPGTHPRRIRSAAALLFLFSSVAPAAAQQPVARLTAEEIARAEAETRYVLPPAPIPEYFRRDPSYATLDAPSADGRYFLVPRWTE